jgi:hypothetical protein
MLGRRLGCRLMILGANDRHSQGHSLWLQKISVSVSNCTFAFEKVNQELRKTQLNAEAIRPIPDSVRFAHKDLRLFIVQLTRKWRSESVVLIYPANHMYCYITPS